jgi:tRNA modification GTPase
VGVPLIRVFNKIDLLKEVPRIKEEKGKLEIYLSAKTGAGIELLRQQLLRIVGWQQHSTCEGLFMARRRHLWALAEAKKHLERAIILTEEKTQPELLAEELRLVQQTLSSITGEFSADDLLGEIFSRFCIGK